ncbi:MAG: TIR domain-containing protein [Candidatus Kapabacteria bacterium]|nr:TIR domain-containing protein [Candidatus Kapabacteria bacterium]
MFISYCWTSPTHEEWVINLAERLTNDGVYVRFDKWDLKEGQDKHFFMESMVTSSDVDKVLLILDEKYTEKANQRKGGVGTETQIISSEIYDNASQEKFIPIATEKDGNSNPFLPTFLKNRIYIDFSETSSFEDSYEKLIRNLYKRPAHTRPQIGKAPEYLFNESLNTFKTTQMVRNFDSDTTKSPQKVNSIIVEFLDNFFEELANHQTVIPDDVSSIDMGRIIHENIIAYAPLRDNYITFTDKLLRSDLPFDVHIYIRFFEKLPLLLNPLDNVGVWKTDQFDNFKFITHEIFLYTIATGLKYEKYHFIEELLYSSYFFQRKYDNMDKPERFNSLYNYVDIINHYYNYTFSKNLICPMAEIILERIHKGYTKDNLIDSDLLCHYVATLEELRWFPITYIYKQKRHIELFKRLVSKRHFESVKCLFGVNTKEELSSKLISLKNRTSDSERIGFRSASESVLPLYKLIDIGSVGSVR